MIKILFICTGNVFRSMSAEKCLKNYLEKHNISDIKSDSAGTGLIPQKINPFVIKRLNHYGIKINHKEKPITQNLINSNDLIIAMSKNHQIYIKKHFNIDVPLFNEIAYNKKTNVLDFEDHNPNIFKHNLKKEIKKYADYTVDHIYNSIPKIINNLNKWV